MEDEKMTTNNNGEIRELSELFILLLKTSPLLNNINYKYESSKLGEDKYSGNYCGVLLANIERKRSIYFELIPFSQTKPRITFTIYRSEKERKSNSEYITLEDSGYLKKYAPELTYCRELNSFEGNLEDKIKMSLECIEGKILIQLIEVLSGGGWIDIEPTIYQYK